MLFVPVIDRFRQFGKFAPDRAILDRLAALLGVGSACFAAHVCQRLRPPERQKRRDGVTAALGRFLMWRIFAPVCGQDFGDREASEMTFPGDWFEFFRDVLAEPFFSSCAI